MIVSGTSTSSRPWISTAHGQRSWWPAPAATICNRWFRSRSNGRACSAWGRSVLEPERFDYTPGRGIAAVIGGATVLVGNRMLLADRGIAVPANLGAKSGSDLMN
jgi:hypothetical protein